MALTRAYASCEAITITTTGWPPWGNSRKRLQVGYDSNSRALPWPLTPEREPFGAGWVGVAKRQEQEERIPLRWPAQLQPCVQRVTNPQQLQRSALAILSTAFVLYALSFWDTMSD